MLLLVIVVGSLIPFQVQLYMDFALFMTHLYQAQTFCHSVLSTISQQMQAIAGHFR
jgi:hypothetical protein